MEADSALRRRIGYLMLFRVVLITLVLGTTVALNLASPEKLGENRSLYLFAIIGVTYVLTLIYALALASGRVTHPKAFANIQISLDLATTTLLVHATGGMESAYSWFYSLSVIGAAMVRGRRGAFVIAAVSALLFAGVGIVTRFGIISVPELGESARRMSTVAILRALLTNFGALIAIAALAAQLATELRRVEGRLEAERTLASNLAAQSADIIRCLNSGLVTVDLAGNVTSWNQAATDITGIPRDAAEGKPLTGVLPGLVPLIAEIDASGSVRRAEIDERHQPDGTSIALGISISPLTDSAGMPIGRIVNFQDLTQLRVLGEAIKRSEQLAVVGKLAASIAHEIRNPLAAIGGSVELLEQGGPPTAATDNDSKTLIEIVKREVDRMNGLVTQLLDYARPRKMVAAPIDLDVIVRETVRVFAQDRSFPGVTPIVETTEHETVVNGDPEQLRQVVWNLLRNGAEAMEAGGELRVGVAATGQRAELRVQDQGVGIASEDIEHIFDPFFTTKKRGTGLGLANVNRIVTEHGGTIAVASVRGKGATFTVALPLATGGSMA